MAEIRYLVITCDHPECTATGSVEWPAERGSTPTTLPLWRQTGWAETPDGDYCRQHRAEARG